MDEPTAWEEINPPTGLAQRHEQQPLSLGHDPETRKVFRNELTACLALVVPVGMTEDSRREWLAVAWATLSHLPPDILSIGCKAARQTCDHPAKIVPTIIAETKEMMGWRRDLERSQAPEPKQIRYERTVVPHEVTQDILRQVREEVEAERSEASRKTAT